MATQAIRQLRWAYNDYGSTTPKEFYDPNIKEANSQSFVKGDLVTVTPGTGTVAEYAADGDHISGIALTAATNVTSGNVPIRIQKILPGDVYIANVYHSNPASSVTAITQLGQIFSLVSTAAGVWRVDLEDSTDTNATVKVVGFVYGPDIDSSGNPYNKALGDTDGEVYIKFCEHAIDTTDGSAGHKLDF